METLAPGEWLTDEIIHYFFRLLTIRDQNLFPQDRSHFFSSFFFTQFFSGGEKGEYTYKAVRTWQRRVPGQDTFNLKHIFFLCHSGGNHWTLAVVRMKEKKIEYYDSLLGNGKRYTNGLWTYLNDVWADTRGGELPEREKWEIVVSNHHSAIQRNCYDCGIFAIMFANYLSINKRINFNQKLISTLRPKMILTILHQWSIDDSGKFIRNREYG